MTSYVTREEYERLTARLDEIERKAASTVVVNVSGDGDGRIRDLVRQGIGQAIEASRRGGDFHRRYAAQKG